MPNPDLRHPDIIARAEAVAADGLAREQWHIGVGVLIVHELRRLTEAVEALR